MRGHLVSRRLTWRVGTLQDLADDTTSAAVLSRILRATLTTRLSSFLLALKATRANLLDDEAVLDYLINVLLFTIHLALLTHHVE